MAYRNGRPWPEPAGPRLREEAALEEPGVGLAKEQGNGDGCEVKHEEGQDVMPVPGAI